MTETYGRLLAQTLPKVIETNEEFDRYVAVMEGLDRRFSALSPEERTLRTLLEHLIEEYDSKIELPEVEPHEMVQHLMEARGLRQADLVAVIGTRAQVSDIVTGKRGISKAHAKKLAEFFKVRVEVFI